MKPVKHLGQENMHEHKMLLLKDCPPVPKGYHWTKQGISSDWCYLRGDNLDTYFWAVRDIEGRLCMGLINHEGYILEYGDDISDIVTVLLTKQKLGLETRLK